MSFVKRKKTTESRGERQVAEISSLVPLNWEEAIKTEVRPNEPASSVWELGLKDLYGKWESDLPLACWSISCWLSGCGPNVLVTLEYAGVSTLLLIEKGRMNVCCADFLFLIIFFSLFADNNLEVLCVSVVCWNLDSVQYPNNLSDW